MKIRTAEQLIDYISSALAWRKKELATLLSLILKNQANPEKGRAMIRSGVTVLYAHWEGFIKESGTKYLEFIYRQDLRCRDLAIPFRALAVKQKLNITGQSQSFKAQNILEITDFLLNKQDDKYFISWEKIIKTHSNLSSEVLREIIIILGLNYSEFETKEKLIDQSLLHFRNNIAHGKGLYPKLDQFLELYREILSLIELFRNQIENSVITEAFKISSSSSKVQAGEIKEAII